MKILLFERDFFFINYFSIHSFILLIKNQKKKKISMNYSNKNQNFNIMHIFHGFVISNNKLVY